MNEIALPWRAEDSGIVTPIMINNGRRIDQRTTLSMQGGADWLVEHLTLNGFDPIVFDGRDPACFAWAILEMEDRLAVAIDRVSDGSIRYPVRLPYGIAVAPKGAGFYGEGTNLAHNLPLKANPNQDARAVENFNASAKQLWVSPAELREAADRVRNHSASGRPRERDHALARRDVSLPTIPEPDFRKIAPDRTEKASPMKAVDATFLKIANENRHLRPRVGNPDEMKSNRMDATLDALKFRVTAPESGVPESLNGAESPP